MVLEETLLPGLLRITNDIIEDERGYFSRAYCEKEFSKAGLCTRWIQQNISHNKCKGVLRGMHYQCDPHAEIKFVRCISGSVYDVVVDLRPESQTFRKWVATELSAENGCGLYIPEGCAHGFQVLEDNSDLYYLMSATYHPESARSVRWDDPAFGIEWPDVEHRIISPGDAGLPDLVT